MRLMATLFACVAVALVASVSGSPNVPCLDANGTPVCKSLGSKPDCLVPHAGERQCCYWIFSHCSEVTDVVMQQRRIYNGMKSLSRSSSSILMDSAGPRGSVVLTDTSSVYFPDAYDAVKAAEVQPSSILYRYKAMEDHDEAEDVKPIPMPLKFEPDDTMKCSMFNNKKDCDLGRKDGRRQSGPCMTTNAQLSACKGFGCQVQKSKWSWERRFKGVCLDAPSTPAPKPPVSAGGDGGSAGASGDASIGSSSDDVASSGGANSLSEEDRKAIQRRAQLSNAFGGCTKSSAGRDCRAFIVGDVGSGGTRFDIYYYTPYKISLGSQDKAATGMYASKLCQCAKEDKNNADHLTNLDLIGREKTGPERQARANKIFKYLFDRCISSIVNEPACMPLAEALGSDVLGFTNPFSDWNESQRSAVHGTADYILEHMPLYLEATAGLREFMIHQPDGEAGVQEIWDRSLDAIRSQSQWKLDDKDFVGKVIEGRFEGYFGMISGFQYLESKPDIFDCVKSDTKSGSESASASASGSGSGSGSGLSVGLRRESNLAEAPAKAKCQHDNVIFLEIGGASQQIAWSIPRALRSNICRSKATASAPASSLLSMSEQLGSSVTPNPVFHPEGLEHMAEEEEEGHADTVLLETETETQTEGIMKVHFPLDPTDRKGISYVYSRSVLGDGNDRTGIQVIERAIKAKFADLSTLKPVNAEFFHTGVQGGGGSSAAPASGASTTSFLEVQSAPASKVATSSSDDEDDSGDDDSDNSSSGASSSGASSSGSPSTSSGGGSSSGAPNGGNSSAGPNDPSFGPINMNDKNVVAIPCWAKGANLMIDAAAYVVRAANSPNGTVEQNELAGVLRWGFDQKFLGDVVLSDTIRTFLTAQFDNERTGFLYGTGDLEGCRKAVEDWIVHGEDDTKTNRTYGEEFAETKKKLRTHRYNFGHMNNVLVSFKPYSFLYAKAVKKGQVKMPMDADDVKKLSDISCSRDAEAADPFSFSPCQVTVFLEKLLQHYGILGLRNARVHVTNQVNWPDAAANFHAEVRSIVKPRHRNLFEVRAFNPHDPNKAENEGQYCVRLLSQYTNDDMDREDDYYKSVTEQFDELKEGVGKIGSKLGNLVKAGFKQLQSWARPPAMMRWKSQSDIHAKILRNPCYVLKEFGEMPKAVKDPIRFHESFCYIYQTLGKPEQKLDEFCKEGDSKRALKEEIKSGWKDIFRVMDSICSHSPK